MRINKLIIIILLPLLLSLIIILRKNSIESRGLYIFLLMALFWMLELIPLAVTAFFPVALFPLFGISDAKKISSKYITSTIIMVIGGLLFALAFEKCNLHKKIAVKVLTVMSGGIPRLLLGCMLTTTFLSLWITNAAVTTMMVPIVKAIIETLNTAKKIVIIRRYSQLMEIEEEIEEVEIIEEEYEIVEMEEDMSEIYSLEEEEIYDEEIHLEFDIKDEDIDKRFSRIGRALLLSICFSSSIGGTGTLIGCGANLVFMQMMEEKFPDATEMTFASWMFYNIPTMILFTIFTWLYLLFVVMKYNKISKEEKDIIKETILKKQVENDRMTFDQCAVSFLFISVILLWFFRDPKFIPGWMDLYKKDQLSNFKITDASPAVFVSLFLFLIPAKPELSKENPPLLLWEKIQNKIQWSIVFLFAGGFAMAEGFKDSGLNKEMEEKLKSLSDVPPVVVMMIVCFITALLTQAVSNVATNTMLLPIITELALTLKVNPLFLMIPLTVSCSLAFCLPVGTPSNAVIYQIDGMKINDMMKPGIAVTLICVITEFIMIVSWGRVIFDFTKFPTWAMNNTQSII